MRYTLAILLCATILSAQPPIAPAREAALKSDLAGQIDAMKKQAQVMVDSVFSFAELGYQEVETNIAAARRFYNAAVGGLNNAIQIFPGSLLARLAGVAKSPRFAAKRPALAT